MTSDVSMTPFPTFSGAEMFVSVHDMIKSFEAAGLKLFRDEFKYSVPKDFSPHVNGKLYVARLIFVKK